jgi:NADPH-dependent 2,4-dienoyl-CoA reductase/sulfur reductase-like enzyme
MQLDVLIVGAGPAGLAAACAAAESGCSVGMVDDNPTSGGQIWRGGSHSAGAGPAHAWFARALRAGVVPIAGTRIVARPLPGRLLGETADGVIDFQAPKVILATGARELFLPFPGWTLPNVMGAGGLQAMVKGGMPIEGKRVVVCGSGPLLLAVAAYLKGRGATVACVAEQAPWKRVRRFALGLWRQPGKQWQAITLRRQLMGIPQLFGTWATSAQGDDRVRAITLTDGTRTWTEACDYLACGFGLVPNVELAVHLGCGVQEYAVLVDEWQETTVPCVYCAGETTGIGGLDKSLIEGAIAGYAAAGRHDRAKRHHAARRRAQAFAKALVAPFVLREELKSLPQKETLVCRCDDVSWGQLAEFDSWRDAKLQTRCGMGPCQGRICGAALAFLRGWRAESIRPPVFPARVETCMHESCD